MPCDRCLDDMDVEIETERMLTVKLGDEYADEGDMMILPYEDAILNVAWIIYEFIVLEVPLTHVHEPGHCNVEMMEALAAHLVTSSEKPDGSEEEKGADEESGKPVDPRWNKLKKYWIIIKYLRKWHILKEDSQKREPVREELMIRP